MKDAKELLRRNLIFIRSHAVETNCILAILFQKEIITLEKWNEMKSPYIYKTDESKIEEIVNILIRKETPFELIIDIFKQSSNILIFEKLNQIWKNETNNISNQGSSPKFNSRKYFENKITNLILLEYTELEVIHGPLIGQGAFGIVLKGEIRKTRQKIAIKSYIKPFSELKKEFENELNIMGRLKHTHIMELFGVLKYDKGSSLIFEYLENGDLLQFVPNNEMLIKFSFEISCGMEYLHYIGILHRDLNASNILLDKKFCIKIGDFGLSRYLEMDADKDYYIVKSETILRLRWVPRECLIIEDQNGKFSKYSDIWSYGATLWEIWNKGLIPFENLPNNEITKALLDGLSPISFYDINSGTIESRIYELMKKIFNHDPVLRPLFLYIKCHLFDIKTGKDSKNVLGNFSEIINISGENSLPIEMQNSLKISEKSQDLINFEENVDVPSSSQIDIGSYGQKKLENSVQNSTKRKEIDKINPQNSKYSNVKLAEKNIKETSQNTKVSNQTSSFNSNEFKVSMKPSKEELPQENIDILKNVIKIYEGKIRDFFQKKENITFETFNYVHEILREKAFDDLELNLPKDLKPIEKSKFKYELISQIERLKVQYAKQLDELDAAELEILIHIDKINIKPIDLVKEATSMYKKNVSEFLRNGINITFMLFKSVHEHWKSRAFSHFDLYITKKSNKDLSTFRGSLERRMNRLCSKFMDQLNLSESEKIELNIIKKIEDKQPQLKKIAIGIHFGTEFIRCCIYSDSDRQFKIIESSKGQFVFQNFVLIYSKEGEQRFLTGENARNEYFKNTDIFSFQYYGNGSSFAIDKRLTKLDQIEYIIGFLLWDILLEVKKIHSGEIHDCVIALPIFSDYLFRTVVKNAGKMVGLKKVHIVTEPMAAAYTEAHIHVDPQQYLVLTHGYYEFDSTAICVQQNNGKIYSTFGQLILDNTREYSYLSKNIMPHGMGLNNIEENLVIIRDSLSTLKRKYDKFYVIFAGDQIPKNSDFKNYLETMSNRLKCDYPQIKLIDYNFTEGIVKGASILAAQFLTGIYNPKNFIEVNPFDISIFNTNQVKIYDLVRNSVIPSNKLGFKVKLGSNGLFKLRYLRKSVDLLIDYRPETEVWVNIENSGVSIVYKLDGKIVGHAKETNWIDEATLEEIQKKFKEYLSDISE